MKSYKSFSESELEGAQEWDLPYVEDKFAAQDTSTNALNRRSDWKYEPPEEPEEILPPTAKEIEAIRQAAHEEGFAQGQAEGLESGKSEGLAQGLEEGRTQGHQEGLEQGLKEGQEQVDTQTQQWQTLTEHMHNPVQEIDEQVRKEVVKLAVALARSVIRTQVLANENVILQALSEGLKALPVTENQYSIHLNPDDLHCIQSHFGEDVIKERGWVLVETPGLERGGCDIVTQNNAVDLSIERRCKNILDKFLLEQGLTDVG